MKRPDHILFSAIMHGQKRTELILYAVLWTIMYAVSAFSLYIGQDNLHTDGFDWHDLLGAWRLLTMFFTAFCIHNFLIAPQLVYRNRRWLYAFLAAALIAAFTGYQVLCRPHRPEKPQPHELRTEERMDARPPMPLDDERPAPDSDMMPPLPPDRSTEPQPKEQSAEQNGAAMKPKPKDMEREKPPRAFGGQDSVAFIIVMLLMGVNVGTKIYFKSLDDNKRMKELERENLNRQLEYLKYQINPHFFMNTLNNIHALVDIDPEQAKQTIEVLSRLMRYMLYDGSKRTALLKNELAFIDNYVRLMRIRYNDHVRIDVSLPTDVSDVKIPPLLFIIFVENAFKHGISYEHPSFIEVKVTLTDDNKVSFLCRNSRKPSSEDVHGGIGLANATKRLKLLYGKDYTLDIRPTTEEYTVQLTIPIQ